MFWRTTLITCLGVCLPCLADTTYSYPVAEARLLDRSNAILAANALAQAGQARADATRHLGLPTVSINAQALAFERHTTLPLGRVNNALNQASTDLSALTGLDVPPAPLPPQLDLTAQKQHLGANITVSMPLYTGGAIDSIKTAATLNAALGKFDLQNETSQARLVLIGRYFDTQLKAALLANERTRYKAMAHHHDNALKLEQQGFISKGTRLQFEVAKNQVLRLYQAASDAHKSSLFALQNLLQDPDIGTLSTPLFINPKHNISWQAVQKDSEQSPFRQKLATLTQLSQEKSQLSQSRKKPTVFAVGQKSLQDRDWFVGVVARHELFSGIDHGQMAYASEEAHNASLFANQKAIQELDTTLYQAYVQFNSAKTTEQLLSHNLAMAKESLRIQTLAFKEGVGTVSGVVDAEAAIAQIQSERAINAYRYIMALATLLHSVDRLDNFAQYASLFDTITIDL